jgi:hypothetical protein
MTEKISAARRLTALPFLCVLLAAFAPRAAVAQAQRRAPRFEDYPVREIYKGRNARVRLTADDRAFRTRLREAARERPNFAGRYVVAAWGCGAGCRTGAVIDAGTGRVYRLPHHATLDYDAGLDFEPVRFRRDSRLLIIFGARDEAPDTDADFGTHYYVFERGRFRQIHFVHKLPHEGGTSR